MDDVYEVRKATYEFLKTNQYEHPILELSPMKLDEMPYPEWFVNIETDDTVWSEEEFFDLEPKFQYSSIVAVNVLEHCRWIWRFPKHAEYLLKEGGRVYIFVPFNLRFHGPAPDLWRFTDTGLNYLMRDFDLISMSYYGSDTNPYGMGVIYQKRGKNENSVS